MQNCSRNIDLVFALVSFTYVEEILFICIISLCRENEQKVISVKVPKWPIF